jgi:ribosomal protein S18 acetylase RimI-like enzyme
MFIREATKHHKPNLIDFQLKMALETENITLEISELSQGIQRLLKDPTKGKYYVAIENEEPIGCLMTTYEWSDWRNSTVLWIQSVYVEKAFRGRGVFKMLYEFIRKMTEESADLRGIRLYVDKTNLAAQKVYEGLGMNGEHYTVYEWMKKY